MAYTTIYTGNINYPTNYYRAYVEYQLTESATSVKVDMKYGVALHSGYVSTSWEQVSRQVACSIGTSHNTSAASSYDIYNGAWVTDSTQLGKTADGKSWWHETGTASKTINKTTSAQTLYVIAWGKVNGVQGTNYATITIPRLARANVTYHVNGGTISANPHKYDDTHYFKVVSNYINLSSTSSGTYSKYTSYIYRNASHYNAYNYTSFGLTKTGYHGKNNAEWNLNSSGTSTSFNEDDTSSNTTNVWTTKRLNKGTELDTDDINVVLYANWEPNTWIIAFDPGEGSGTMSSSTHTYGTAKALPANTFTAPTGKHFVGWLYTRSDGTTVHYADKATISGTWAGASSSGNTYTMVAQWALNTWTIHFDGNGNTGGSMDDQVHTYGTAKALPANGFTKTGYHLIGWNRDKDAADAGTVQYSPTYSMSGTWTSSNGQTFTFYAVWEKDATQWVQIDGAWKEVAGIWVQIEGTWKEVANLSVNIDNSWKT